MNREAIYSAVFAQLAAIPGFAYSSRVLKHWTDAQLQPALFQAQAKETAFTTTGQPTRWELRFNVYLYAKSDASQTVPPLNPLLDAVTNAINARDVNTNRNRLANIANVDWVRVDGTIETDEGTLGQQAVAIVPVLIQVTD